MSAEPEPTRPVPRPPAAGRPVPTPPEPLPPVRPPAWKRKPRPVATTPQEQKKLCPTPAKLAYQSQNRALSAALSASRKFGVARPYRCACGWWHLTVSRARY